MSKKISILLVDDHMVVRSGLSRLLELCGDVEVVAEAESGEQAYQLYNELMPDVLVMDMSMPGVGGLEALRKVIARHASAKVVIYSMHETSNHASQALSAGAKGYVAKSGAADDLILAVREVVKGNTYLSPEIAQKIVLQSVSGSNDPMLKLSTREFEVFRLLAEGVSVEDIADMLNVSQKTVSNYQTSLKQKLGINNAVELVRLAIKQGVILS